MTNNIHESGSSEEPTQDDLPEYLKLVDGSVEKIARQTINYETKGGPDGTHPAKSKPPLIVDGPVELPPELNA